MNSMTGSSQSRTNNTIWICRLICSHPFLYFGVCLFFFISTFGVSLLLYFLNYDILPTNFDKIPLDLTNSDVFLKQTAWNYRFTHMDQARKLKNNMNETTKLTKFDELTTTFIYYSEDPEKNLLTKENLEIIQMIENNMYNDSEYKRNFCYQKITGDCHKPFSILRLFDGTYSSLSPVFQNASFLNIGRILTFALLNVNLKEYHKLFGNNVTYNLESEEVFANSLMTMHFFGLPQHNSETKANISRQQENKIKEYLIRVWKDIWKDYSVKGFQNLKIVIYNKVLYWDEVFQLSFSDMYLVIGSFIFILLFVWVQTHSFFLSFMGFLNTAFSFVGGNLIYNIVLDFKYIGNFHIFSVFIIVGIAADDIFIFCDTWKSLKSKEILDLTFRLSQCYKHAAKSMLVTSLTTSAAFILNAFSPILAISSFGAFAGIVVLVNYFYLICFYPSVLIIWHLQVKKFVNPFVFLCTSKKLSFTGNSDNKIYINLPLVGFKSNPTRKNVFKKHNFLTCNRGIEETFHFNRQSTFQMSEEKIKNFCLTKRSTKSKNSAELWNIDLPYYSDNWNNKNVTNTSARTKLIKNQIKTDIKNEIKLDAAGQPLKPKIAQEIIIKERRAVHFFGTTYYRYIKRKVFKITVYPSFLILIIIMIYFVLNIKLNDEQPKAMKADHYMEKFITMYKRNFNMPLKRNSGNVYIIWGILPQDMSKCHSRRYDGCVGENRWDINFNLNFPSAQSQLLEFCDLLYNMDKDMKNYLKIRSNDKSKKTSMKCFIRDMNSYLKSIPYSRHDSCNHGNKSHFSIPMSALKTYDLMSLYPALYHLSNLTEHFDRYFETAYAHWVTDRYSDNIRPVYEMYSELIGESGESRDLRYATEKSDSLYGAHIKFVAIEISLNIPEHSTSYKDGIKIYDRWEKFLKNQTEKMDPPLRRGYQTTTIEWHWFYLQKVLFEQAALSIILGILIAWVVLVISSGNWIIGTIAVVTIALICLCVVGVIPLVGWKFGVLEAMNMTLVVGLSVDYVVHLGVAYTRAPLKKREDRVQASLREYGVSIMSGAITTLGSSFFMFFAKISFFSQFGAFMFVTIGFSIVFALTFFPSVLLIIGPQGKTGSLSALIQLLGSRIFKKSSSQDDLESFDSTENTLDSEDLLDAYSNTTATSI